MHSLSRIRQAANEAATLPNPHRSLAAQGIDIRRGEVSMVAGPPGAGKSTFALDFAIRSGQPTVYFSADTHAYTMKMRTLAMLTGMHQSEVEPLMAADPEWAARTLARANHIGWCFESAPSLRDMEQEIEAHREVHGEDPKLVVFDNLIDASFDSGDEYGSMRALLREFKWWARDTDAAFLVLHHTSESVPGNPCPPRSALHGKVAQTPAMILTVTGDNEGFMGVAAVKNRYGRANASGSDPVWLLYNPSNMQIKDVVDR